jgi:hypothetical protein
MATATPEVELVLVLEPALVMICDSTVEALPAKALSPSYIAVMEWGEPADESEEAAKAALPEVFNVAVPRLLLPSKRVTVPVGTPPLPLTVAVKVTRLPAAAGFCEEATVVVLGLVLATVFVLVTTWESRLEVLPG